jgi:hypothetical protein
MSSGISCMGRLLFMELAVYAVSCTNSEAGMIHSMANFVALAMNESNRTITHFSDTNSSI